MAKEKDLSGKPTQDGLDVGGANKLDVKNEVQDVPDDEAQFIKPDVKMEPMTTNVTVPVQRIKHLPGEMAVVTTTAGELLVPSVAFVNGKLPSEVAAGEEDEPADTSVVVTAAYARSQGLI